jgi:hypothetical protein
VVGLHPNGHIGIRYLDLGPRTILLDHKYFTDFNPDVDHLIQLDVTFTDDRNVSPYQRFELRVWECTAAMPDEPDLVVHDDRVTSGFVGLSSCDDCHPELQGGRGIYRFFWVRGQLAPGEEPPEPRFSRGDCNGDGEHDVSDAVCILSYLFLGGGSPGCLDALDAEDSGVLDITDAVYLLEYLFLGGPAPLPPFPRCGVDPTDELTGDDLTCEAHAPCQPTGVPPECE